MSSHVNPASLSFTALLAHVFALGSAAASSSESSSGGAELVRLVSLLAARSNALSLVSDNDELRDLTTSSLRALFVDSLAGVAYSQAGPPPGTAETDIYALRRVALQKSTAHFQSFLATLVRLRLLSPSLVTLITSQSGRITDNSDGDASSSSPAPLDAAARRALKINLFKTERSLSTSLDTYRLAAREKRRFRAQEAPTEAFWDPLILRRGAGGRVDTADDNNADADGEVGDDEDEEDEDDVIDTAPDPTGSATPTSLRSYLLLLLCLHALKASSSLESASQELALLSSMPPPEILAREAAERDIRARSRAGISGVGDDGRGEQSWKLDGGGLPTSGPLLDPKGKPLRPFTITGANGKGAGAPPAELTDRERLRSEVFRPGHRLPTMSIDEFLEEEERRGNIIQGGGAASAEKPTTAEARALRAEQDGTLDAEFAADEATTEARRWDAFSEENKRGAGNTMNRG